MLEKFESSDIQRMRRVFNDRVQYVIIAIRQQRTHH